MMRLTTRRNRFWHQSYLVYRSMWPNIESAIERAKSQLPSSARVVVDVGCGNKPYKELFADCFHVGLNYGLDGATPDLLGDAMRLPFRKGSVDLVFCTQVLEHVPRPFDLIAECSRVLKSGGWLVLTAPFYWPLHEEPHDYFRFTKYGLERLASDAGFKDIQLLADGGDYSRFCVSALHVLPRWLEIGCRPLMNGLGVVLDKVMPSYRLPMNYTLVARAGS